MTIQQDIEEQLRQAILSASITRYRLSVLSGVTQGVLSLFVNRHRTITMETAAKLAAVLGLTLKPVKPANKHNKRMQKGR